jgi:hypothetical protein
MHCLNRNNNNFFKIVKQLVYTGCFTIFMACSPFAAYNDPSEKELAKVGVYTLYLSDVLDAVQINGDKDSAATVKLYVNNWVKSHVVLQKAETELYAEEKKFSKQLEEYRNSLIRYAYEKKYIAEHLDTVVTEKEIQSFYNQNAKNFELKQDVVRVRYALLDKKKGALKSKAKTLLQSNKKTAQKEFLDFCKKNKLQGYWDDSTWVFFDDFMNVVPIVTYNNDDFLRSSKYYEGADSVKYSLVTFTDFKIKDGASPLEFEREKIKRIILNQRKIKLVEEMEKLVYDEAVKDGEVEEY